MFYNADIDTPLSVHLNNPTWQTSPLAQLVEGSNLEELHYHPRWSQFQNVAFAWRVVGAWYPDEDSTMTQFRAYGIHGEQLPYASFGVNHSQVGKIDLTEFSFHPWQGDRYYVPRDNQIHTKETGGYFVEVLDTAYPSEGMKFGLSKSGGHRCLVISFRLMPFDFLRYPNDTTKGE